ncbi:AAA family ATPase [Stappia stellulata]|uniref:AAA family ATPase n=1 Tax=Stappia stellulata TaxID=71235 RepID=UPI0004209CA2|nr:AAA family ATPase [Stappia stellulata]
MPADPVRPVLTIFAGPNGSGKTTLRNQFVKDGYDLGAYVNADDILARGSSEVPASTSRPDREAWAFNEAERQRQALLEGGEAFSFETVFSHESKLDFMRKAREAGYFIRLLFVATDSPALNVARVSKRVRDGGHDVETRKVVARYKRTLTLLPLAIEQADHAVLFDNSGTTMRAVVALMRSADFPASFHVQTPIPEWIDEAMNTYRSRKKKT